MNQRPVKLRTKLASMLRAKGLIIEPEDIRPALGHYRSSRYADVYRWDAWCVTRDFAIPDATYPNGIRINLASWDTITDCVRYGFELSNLSGDSSWQIDASSNKP